MTILGINIYCWGDPEMRRLLAEGLRPVAREVRLEGLANRFFYKSFDSRGPHVFALFQCDPERREALQYRLHRRLSKYLESHPSRHEMSEEELQTRHRECRGAPLCSVDREPGFEANNSLRFFAQDPSGYPFRLALDATWADEVWQHMDSLAFWSLDRLRHGSLAADAVRFAAHVDQALAAHEAESCWRLQASMLIPSLQRRLPTEEEAVVASLEKSIGARNMTAFTSLWSQLPTASDLSALVPPLIRAAAAEDGRRQGRRFALVRDIVHSTLHQLQQPTVNHIPIVLYAWLRRLREVDHPGLRRAAVQA